MLNSRATRGAGEVHYEILRGLPGILVLRCCALQPYRKRNMLVHFLMKQFSGSGTGQWPHTSVHSHISCRTKCFSPHKCNHNSPHPKETSYGQVKIKERKKKKGMRVKDLYNWSMFVNQVGNCPDDYSWKNWTIQ